MEAWIPITIAAAAAQTLRFMVQRRLAQATLSPIGATFARFVWSAPIVVTGVLIALATGAATLPSIPPIFWGYAVLGGVAQVLATTATVSLFKHRNFAVGITFKKTEVIQTAFLGAILLGDYVPPAGLAAIALGMVGVLLLSDPPETTGTGPARFFNRAAGIGLLSGLLFAISGVGYRGAIISLEDAPTAVRSAVALALVTTGQSIGTALWLRFRNPGEITRVLTHWRETSLVGILSLMGSYGWFTAFSLQSAAYVFALGQVEVIFSVLASALIFGERIRQREFWGILILVASVVALVALG